MLVWFCVSLWFPPNRSRYLFINALSRVPSDLLANLTRLSILHLHVNAITLMEHGCFRDQKQSLTEL